MTRTRPDFRPHAVAAALLFVLVQAAPAHSLEGPRTAMDERWHFAVTPYFWFTGLEGAVSAKGVIEAPVDASFSDIWNNFDIGVLGRFEGRRNRIGFTVDTSYLNLGAEVARDRPILGQLGLEADIRSLISEGLVFYRVTSGGDRDGAWLDVFGGGRFVGTSAQLKGTTPDGSDLSSTKQTIDWVDALVGARFRVPLGKRLGLDGRGDVAGLGSDFSWNLQGGLDLALGERWALGAGYRHLDIDYDKESNGERKLFRIKFDGAYSFVSFAW